MTKIFTLSIILIQLAYANYIEKGELKMVNDKHLLAKEFLFLSSDDINISKFIKLPNDTMTYETTRSAFIIPISGKSEICFSNQNL